MRPPPTIRLWITAILAGCLAVIVAALVTAAAEVVISYAHERRVNEPADRYGFRGYGAYVRIESIDTASRTMIATIDSIAAGQPLRTEVTLDHDFLVERRDAIIENGTFVGVREKQAISLERVTAGMRGFAYFRNGEDGKTYARYLLIGDPFPRP